MLSHIWSSTAAPRSYPGGTWWAEWIAWELEGDEYRVLIQAWDMVAGANWVNSMHKGV
jgi:hypothetical protein